MSDAYNVGFKDGAAAGYRLAIEDMKLDKKPQIMKKYEGDHATLLTRHNALREAAKNLRDTQMVLMQATRDFYTPKEHLAHEDALSAYRAARAEVDRLIANADDCEGEG